MRVLYYADARSPIAQDWVQGIVEAGHEVHWVSSRALQTAPIRGLSSFGALPLIPGMVPRMSAPFGSPGSQKSKLSLVGSSLFLHWVVPLLLQAPARRFAQIADEVRPELIHALRIPPEGMLAAAASRFRQARTPILMSVWGNDFTLHAPASPMMARQTRFALRNAAGLHVDCNRDYRLAQQWGFDRSKPVLVAPGNGGIRMEVFSASLREDSLRSRWGLPDDAIVVVNPRGLRGYVRNDTFFKSIPLILREVPRAFFMCVGMAGSPLAQRYVKRLGIGDSVRLLPALSASEMSESFRLAQVSVSLSEHDGTPNTLLEAMACGCYPVAGEIESLREWIQPGRNGDLVSASDPRQVARAVVAALGSGSLRREAAQVNVGLVAARAEHTRVLREALVFYSEVAAEAHSAPPAAS